MGFQLRSSRWAKGVFRPLFSFLNSIEPIIVGYFVGKAVDFFKNSVLILGGENIEEQIIKKARASFDTKMETDIIPELEEQEWINRTGFPIGLDNNNNFFPLLPTEKVIPQILPLYNAIFKITNDTDLNIPANVI